MTPGSHSNKTELLTIGLAVMEAAQKIDITEVDTAQKAMLLLHVEWEALVNKSRNRAVDGYEPIVSQMKAIAATAIAVSAVLQAKLMNAWERRLVSEEKDEVVFSKPGKPEKVAKRRGPGRRGPGKRNARAGKVSS